MEINRACTLGEIVNPAAISTYFTEPAAAGISTLFPLYFYKVPGLPSAGLVLCRI